MSSADALREGTPFVPDTPTDPKELRRQLREHATRLDVINLSTAYGAAMQVFDQAVSDADKDEIFLLELDLSPTNLVVRSYRDAAKAAEEYGALERAVEGEERKDVVLVRVEAVTSLRRAYPNYFLDTSAFVDSVRDAIA